MTRAQLAQEALRLPADERFEMAELLLESLDDVEIPLQDWHKALLDERLTEANANPERFECWDDIKDEVLAQIRQRAAARR